MMIKNIICGFKDDFLTTFKIFNDFGPRTQTWRLVESMPSE